MIIHEDGFVRSRRCVSTLRRVSFTTRRRRQFSLSLSLSLSNSISQVWKAPRLRVARDVWIPEFFLIRDSLGLAVGALCATTQREREGTGEPSPPGGPGLENRPRRTSFFFQAGRRPGLWINFSTRTSAASGVAAPAEFTASHWMSSNCFSLEIHLANLRARERERERERGRNFLLPSRTGSTDWRAATGDLNGATIDPRATRSSTRTLKRVLDGGFQGIFLFHCTFLPRVHDGCMSICRKEFGKGSDEEEFEVVYRLKVLIELR